MDPYVIRSPKRRQPDVDTQPEAPDTRGERSAEDVSKAVQRMLVALRKRASAGDDAAAVELIRLAGMARREARDGIAAAHRYGYSYGDLAAFLGVTRQAVAQMVERQSRPDRQGGN